MSRGYKKTTVQGPIGNGGTHRSRGRWTLLQPGGMVKGGSHVLGTRRGNKFKKKLLHKQLRTGGQQRTDGTARP